MSPTMCGKLRTLFPLEQLQSAQGSYCVELLPIFVSECFSGNKSVEFAVNFTLPEVTVIPSATMDPTISISHDLTPTDTDIIDLTAADPISDDPSGRRNGCFSVQSTGAASISAD